MRVFLKILCAVVAISIAVPEIGLAPSVSYAQQAKKDKRKNLLEMLFGGALRKQRKARKKRTLQKKQRRAKRLNLKKNKSKKRIVRKKTSGSRVAKKTVVAATKKPVVQKNPDAVTVLVIGDFMADALTDGLVQIFSQNPAIRFVNASKGLSGIVRNDVLDWPTKVPELVESHKPAVVVGLLGMNDRQEMRIASGRVKKLTEPWKAEYEKRVEALLRTVRENRLPMIWVGLPPVRSSKMNADYLNFNSTYRRKVELFGGTFVDVWNGFVDIEGRYIRSGPDVDGQIVRLRFDDGINMTRRGKLKLGFYTEKAIKRLTGIGKESLFSSVGSLSDQTPLEATYDPVKSGKTITIALGSPAADGGGELEGGEGFLTASDASFSTGFELLARGQLNDGQEGRIDFGWGKSSFAPGRLELPEPVLANMRGMNFKSPVGTAVIADVSKDGEAAKMQPAAQSGN